MWPQHWACARVRRCGSSGRPMPAGSALQWVLRCWRISAARSAVTAVELARRGMPGPREPITGEFGYFELFDGKADPAPLDELGERWRIAEISHKPFPSGRATHGGIDGLQRLMNEDGVAGDRVVG